MPSASPRRMVAGGLALLAVGFALTMLAKHWDALRLAAADTRVEWLPVSLSMLMVLATYGLLIETWRRMLRTWSSTLPPLTAARIWFVSNLGRYLPGKVWQIAAMGVMAQRAGVGPEAAVGSSLVIAVVNILAGLAVIALAGRSAFATLQLSWPTLLAAAAVAVTATLPLPWYLPTLVRTVNRMTGRDIRVPQVPLRAIVEATLGCTAAWVGYGLAFSLLVSGLAPMPAGATPGDHVAVFALSYLAGYLALFAPGGIGVREVAMASLLTGWLTYDAGTAGIIVVASRAWLTLLELLPGLLFLAVSAFPKTLSRPT